MRGLLAGVDHGLGYLIVDGSTLAFTPYDKAVAEGVTLPSMRGLEKVSCASVIDTGGGVSELAFEDADGTFSVRTIKAPPNSVFLKLSMLEGVFSFFTRISHIKGFRVTQFMVLFNADVSIDYILGGIR